ncbi:MAG: transposase [Taibaiella sp.]|nr:transposase [Taibaiella sp.]
MLFEFDNLVELVDYFDSEKVCRDYLEYRRWKGTITCVYCSCKKVYKYETKPLYKCSSCKRRFSLTKGTVFEKTRIPFRKWFIAMYMYVSTGTFNFAATNQLWDYWLLPNYNSISSVGATGSMGAGIVVQPGGKLIINGAILKGINNSPDRNMWDGIIVAGNPSATRSYTTQGDVEISGNATIQDAIFGIAASRTYRNNSLYQKISGTVYTATTYGSSYTTYGDQGGAILNVDHCTFQNCRNGINMQKYIHSTTLLPPKITNCTFQCDNTGMADVISYNDGNGNPLPTNAHLAAWAVDYIQLVDNTFSCDASFPPNLRSTGIVSADAGMHITPTCTGSPAVYPCSSFSAGNSFTNLFSGITSTHTFGNSYLIMDINRNSFDNNQTAINVQGSKNGLVIYSNSIKVPATSGSQTTMGINLVSSTGYSITYNTLDKCSTCSAVQYNIGIHINDRSILDNNIANNQFNNLYFNSMASQINGSDYAKSGLVFRCNNYASGFYDIFRNSNLMFTSTIPAIIAPSQGGCGSSNPPAQNQFNHSCLGANHLYNDIPTTQFVSYFHGSATNTNPGSCISSKYSNRACISGSIGYSYTCPNDIKVIVPNNTHFTLSSANLQLGRIGLRQMDTVVSATSQSDSAYSQLVSQRNLMISEWALYYNFNGNDDSAAILLEGYKRYNEAFDAYMHGQMWSDAQRMLDSLPHANADDSLFSYYSNIAYTLYSAGNTWFDMDSTDKDSLHHIFQYNSVSGSLAGAVDTLLEMGPLYWPYPVPDTTNDSLGQRQSRPLSQEITNDTYSIYPNPFNGTFTLNSTEEGRLTIYNIEGMLVGDYNVTKGKMAITFPNNTLPGIYISKFVPLSRGSNPIITRLIYCP